MTPRFRLTPDPPGAADDAASLGLAQAPPRERRREGEFRLAAGFAPAGDQPQAIDALEAGLTRGDRHQTLLGATGTGKTFTIANVIARVQRSPDYGHTHVARRG